MLTRSISLKKFKELTAHLPDDAKIVMMGKTDQTIEFTLTEEEIVKGQKWIIIAAN